MITVSFKVTADVEDAEQLEEWRSRLEDLVDELIAAGIDATLSG